MRREKFYTYLDEEQKTLLSLNFLLAEKITTDAFVSEVDIKNKEIKAKSKSHKNNEFFCMLFFKHISRYLPNVEKYKFAKI
jgi:hypothetical protein